MEIGTYKKPSTHFTQVFTLKTPMGKTNNRVCLYYLTHGECFRSYNRWIYDSIQLILPKNITPPQSMIHSYNLRKSLSPKPLRKPISQVKSLNVSSNSP